MIFSNSAIRTLAVATLLGGAICCPITSLANSHGISVEKVSNLHLAGYEDGDDAMLQWTLNAGEGIAPKNSVPGSDITKTLWELKKLKLVTYTAGKHFAQMESADARFDFSAKAADSDALVTVVGENFSVRGNGWSWKTSEGKNLIKVKRNVSVSLSVPEKDGKSPDKKIAVASDNLEITGADDSTLLVFRGNVAVIQGDTRMTGDVVSVLIPGNVAKTNLPNAQEKEKLDVIQKISATGNVKIATGAQTLLGDVVEFFPQEDRYAIRGNARLDAPEHGISVAGENASGNIVEKTADITPKSNSLVRVKIVPRDSGKSGDNVPATTIVGKRLSLGYTSEGNAIVDFSESVFLSDETMHINCDKLTLTAKRGSNSVATAEKSEKNILSIVALGNVVAVSDGRTLRCNRADVFPPQSKISLTGVPSVEVPKEGAVLAGNKIEIFWETDSRGERRLKNIDVFGVPSRRVTVTLPSLDRMANKKERAKKEKDSRNMTAAETTISGDRLSMIRGDKVNTFDIDGNVVFSAKELSGTCARMVVFTDAEMKNKDARSVVRRIEALGNVSLQEKSTRLTGDSATLDVNPQVTEWLAADDNGSDGNTRVLIKVLPNPENKAGTRPRIYLPTDGENAFALNLAQGGTGKKNQKKGNSAASLPAAYIEGDLLEILAGEDRTRFWLRDSIELHTDETTGTCDSIEGLLMPEKNTTAAAAGTQGRRKFEAEKVIGRGNVKIKNAGANASGKTLEIFPKKNLAVLSGNACLSDAQGVQFTPGASDKFIFDLVKRELVAAVPAEGGATQVSRPKITIPRGTESSFIVPVQKKK